mmetsp:Transcript_56654/g.98710  ORF Transcript_56654/g.98710 Transcript_56654/m.98710 type:complete len:406 (-) Transcript_56654:112-1329(-)
MHPSFLLCLPSTCVLMFIPGATRWWQGGVSVRQFLHGVAVLLLVTTESMRMKDADKVLPSLASAIAADGSGVKAVLNSSPIAHSLHNSSVQGAPDSSGFSMLHNSSRATLEIQSAASSVDGLQANGLFKANFSIPGVVVHSLMQLRHFASGLGGSVRDDAVHRSRSALFGLPSDSVLLIGFAALTVALMICLYYCVHSWGFILEEELDEIEQLAFKLQRKVQKYPSTKAHRFSKPKDRFIAVLPQQDHEAKHGSQRRHTMSFSRRSLMGMEEESNKWEVGKLLWWDDATSFFKHEEPKGYIKLAGILAVSGGQTEKWEHREVEVSFVDGTEVERLVLLLPSQSEAQDWANTLSVLLEKARPTTSSYPRRRHGTFGGGGIRAAGSLSRAHTDSVSSGESCDANETS